MLNVRSLGATGDGVTDDGPAIQKIIDSAPAGSTVVFPPGNYKLSNGTDSRGYGLVIHDTHGLTLQGGHGVVLLSDAPAQTFLKIANATDIVIEGLALMRTTPVFSQGRVQSIDISGRTVQYVADPTFPGPEALGVKEGKFLLVFNDDAHGSWGDHSAACAWYKPEDSGVCWPPTITSRKDLGGGKWLLQLNTAPSENYVGAPGVIWGGSFYKGRGFIVDQSSNVTLSDIDYFPRGADGFIISGSTGKILLRRLRIDVPPGVKEYVSSVGGGMVFNNAISLTLDHTVIRRVWDDCLNMGSHFARVVGQDSPRILDVDAREAVFRAGDSLAIWDWDRKVETARARIVSIQQIPDRAGFIRVTIDRDVGALHVGPAPETLHSGGNSDDRIDRVIDIDAAGELTVENSTFQSLHARDLFVKAARASIHDNLFEDTVAAAILAGPTFFWDEGPAIDSLNITHNIFRNVSGPGIFVESEGSTESRDNKHIDIKDNEFVDSGRFAHGIQGPQGAPVVLRNVDGAEVRGNEVVDPLARTAINNEVTDSSHVTAEPNAVRK